ncbi:MAG: alkaline phosphatase family protein, partial [Actinomycetota bacterium]
MSKRVLVIVAVAVVIAAGAAWALRPATGVPEDAPTENEMATELGSSLMEHLHAGHVPGRSGEIMLVPKPHSFLLGEWDLTTLGTDTPTLSTSHPNPWDYLTRVPIIAAGGELGGGQSVAREVDIADIAPSYARMMGMEGFDADGEPLDELTAAFSGSGRPKVIFTVVIDGGGWNTLQQHPDSWPVIDGLRDEGLTYTNATIASAPSITGALHATIGTGDLPLHHGIPGNQMRGPDGENTDTWQQNADPSFLQSPTIGDVWDAENANRPIVGTVSYEGWHLGMIGHGAAYEGGDKDLAVLWE